MTLLLDSPPCVLEEFGLLAPLLQELADRLSFLCSWVLELFLDPETPRHSEADHLEVVLNVLLQKLAEEIERLRETCSRPAGLCLHEALCDYRDHLLRRARQVTAQVPHVPAESAAKPAQVSAAARA